MDVPVAANVLGTLGAVRILHDLERNRADQKRCVGPFRYLRLQQPLSRSTAKSVV